MAAEVAITGDLAAEALGPLRHRRACSLWRDEVGLGERQHARQSRETRVVRGQLLLDRRVVGHRVGVVLAGDLGGEVEHVHQQARALHVRKELMAEPAPTLAPSIRPGMSATTSWRSSDSSTPSTGSSVVKG